jgi:hypothetical protein
MDGGYQNYMTSWGNSRGQQQILIMRPSKKRRQKGDTSVDWGKKIARGKGALHIQYKKFLPILYNPQAGMAIRLHHTNFSNLYFRNYGYVPYAKCDAWRKKIAGLVKWPTIFTMQSILQLSPTHELPTTPCDMHEHTLTNLFKHL